MGSSVRFHTNLPCFTDCRKHASEGALIHRQQTIHWLFTDYKQYSQPNFNLSNSPLKLLQISLLFMFTHALSKIPAGINALSYRLKA